MFKTVSEKEGRFKGYHYEVGDAKSSRHSKFCQQMQAAFYSLLLQPIQENLPRYGKIFTRPSEVKNKEEPFKEECFLIDDLIWTLKTFMEEEIWEIASSEEGEYFFHPTSSCQSCPWYSFCKEMMERNKDISILPDIRKAQRKRLIERGIHTIENLESASDSMLKEASKGPGAGFEGLEKLRWQAASIINDKPILRDPALSPRIICKSMTEREKETKGYIRGVSSLDFTNADQAFVYFDMESDPYAGIEYLFGLLFEEHGKRTKLKNMKPEFIMSEDSSLENEFNTFLRFLQRMNEIRKKYGDEGYIIFHYASYEPSHLLRLAEKFSDRELDLVERVDSINGRMVDLYKLIRKTYYLPVSSYSIKEVAPCIKNLLEKEGISGGHEWKKLKSIEELEKELKQRNWKEQDISNATLELNNATSSFGLDSVDCMLEPSADMSVVWFKLYNDKRNPIWKTLIEIYNEDDLLATKSLVDWLLLEENKIR